MGARSTQGCTAAQGGAGAGMYVARRAGSRRKVGGRALTKWVFKQLFAQAQGRRALTYEVRRLCERHLGTGVRVLPVNDPAIGRGVEGGAQARVENGARENDKPWIECKRVDCNEWHAEDFR